jgi:hypothetical protein
LLATWTASVAVLVTLSAVNGTFRPDALTDSVPLLLAFASFMVVGALIVGHRPENAVGWILSAIAFLAVLGALAEEYAPSPPPTACRPGPGRLVRLLGLVPDHHPGPAVHPAAVPRRPAADAALAAPGLAGRGHHGGVHRARRRPADPRVGRRPGGQPHRGGRGRRPEQSMAGQVLVDLIGVLVVAAVASLVVRLRRSQGEERLQLKWFTYACALLPLVVLSDQLPDALGNLLFAAVVSCLPVAAGVAILRYRLYEIDRLINRTLVYGLLTAVLAGIYAALVLAGGLLSGGLGGQPPSWAVAGATLAVAALFQPARRRIQRVVDRRFDRRRYVAAGTGSFIGRAARGARTWTPWRPSCWPWSTRRASRPGPRCG